MDAKIKTEIVKLVHAELEKHIPKKDFIELRMNMETVMRHSEKHKKEVENNNVIMSSINSTLTNIEMALVPHKLNDNKGLISEFGEAKVEIEKLKGIIKVHRVYFALLGALIIGSGIIGYSTRQILKDKTEITKQINNGSSYSR